MFTCYPRPITLTGGTYYKFDWSKFAWIGSPVTSNHLLYMRADTPYNYVYTTGNSPRQSVWSYVGRAEYLTGRFPQARQSLEQALSGNREENIARLYLGLTLSTAWLEGKRKRDARD